LQESEVIPHHLLNFLIGLAMHLPQHDQATVKILLIENKHRISQSANEIDVCAMLFTQCSLETKEDVGDVILDSLLESTQIF
jgi:hypothetical protein